MSLIKKWLYKMVSELFHIKINSDEANKDNGFFTLMTSGASIVCLDNEEYIVPEVAVDRLNIKKIIYEVVIKKGEKENATDKTTI